MSRPRLVDQLHRHKWHDHISGRKQIYYFNSLENGILYFLTSSSEKDIENDIIKAKRQMQINSDPLSLSDAEVNVVH